MRRGSDGPHSPSKSLWSASDAEMENVLDFI